MKHPEIRWGVIGVGDVCRVKSAPAMNKIKDSRIVAVMRRNGTKAKAYAAEHDIPHWYDKADDLLADPEVNTVYIATPPHVHLELTRKAAAAGKPVYVEKPMALTHQECLDMIAVCEDAEVPLYVAYYRRALPNYLKIRDLVQTKAIGDVRTVHIQMSKPAEPKHDTDPGNWRVNPAIAGGGYFYDLASHQLDFLDYLFDSITEVSGFAANRAGLYEAEDLVTGTFRFANGVLGTGCWNFASGKSAKTDLITITGNKGVISYPTFDGYYVDLITDEPYDAENRNMNPGNRKDDNVSHETSRQQRAATKKTGEHYFNRFEFNMPKHIQQPLIQIIVDELLASGWGDSKRSKATKRSQKKLIDAPCKCPSNGITAARTNLVMEKLIGK